MEREEEEREGKEEGRREEKEGALSARATSTQVQGSTRRGVLC